MDDTYELTVDYTDVTPGLEITTPKTTTKINAFSDNKDSVAVEAAAGIKDSSTLSAITSARYYNDNETEDLTVGELKNGKYPVTGNIPVAADGIYKYRIEVTNNEGQTAVSDEFEIIRDTEAPVISDPVVKQDGKVIGSGEKVTADKDVQVSFKVSDAVSKVSQVTFDGNVVIPDEAGVCNAAINADTLGGNKEKKIRIVAEDEMGNSNESNPFFIAIQVYIPKADQPAPAALEASAVTAYSVTLKAVNGCEYSMDGTTWQKEYTFTGLAKDTEYTFYQRLSADENYNTSPSSSAKIRTAKTYRVIYEITGEIPDGAPKAPADTNEYEEKVEVKTKDALSMEGYTFSGWSSKDVSPKGG